MWLARVTGDGVGACSTGLPQTDGGEAEVGGKADAQHFDDVGGSEIRTGRRSRRVAVYGEQAEDDDADAEVEHVVAHVARHEEKTAGPLRQPPTGKTPALIQG